MTFVVVNKRTRRPAEEKPAREAEEFRRKREEREERPASQVAAETRAALRPFAEDGRHLFDIARPGMTPIAFAELILSVEKRTEKIGGHDFIDSRPATPLAKLLEANRILKRLGLEPIEGSLWQV